jgi:hypothetical protein
VRPNGLNAAGQHSSAYDLALFARQALTMREFMRIEATVRPSRAGVQRAGHLVQPAGFPLTAEIGALLLAALTAGGIVILLRRRAGRETPPGP